MNIFSYESKFNHLMMTIADLVILNILYILCCIPVFTISSAQAGLFTGIRVMLDKDDDRSVVKSFFRGFADGFGKSAIAGTILLVVQAVALLAVYFSAVYYGAGNSILPLVLSIVLAVAVYTTHSILGPFHATFGCSVGQLIRNAFFVAFAYPLRSLLVALLTLLPVIIFLIWPQIILGGIIAFLGLYYSTAYLLCHSLLKKPFDRLKKSFREANSEDEDEDEEEESETEDE